MKRFVFALTLLLGVSHSFAQSMLSREKAVEDIDYYIRVMKESHYAPFMYISQAAYDAQVKQLKATIGDSIGIRDFVLLCYQVTALTKDAHCTPNLVQAAFMDEFKKEQFFPYKIVQDKHLIYAPLLLAKDLDIPEGTELVTINGKKFNALFEQIQSGIAGIPAFKEEAACRLMPYFLFLHGIQPPFVLGYKDEKGVLQQVTLPTGTTFKKALTASLPHLVQPYHSEIVEGTLGYIDVRSLSGDVKTFGAFLDTCFQTFRKANVKAVAIDLRQNSGGNTLLGDVLFSYITDKKYSWGNKSWRISQAYKDYLVADGDTGAAYLKQPNGTVWESGNNCVPEENKFTQNEKFQGKVFFITGPFTFSSAMAMADVVKTYHLGTLVGEPTGEDTQDFGEAFGILMPNSKIKIQSTTSFSHGADCHRTKNSPVQPDIPISRELVEKVWGKDKALHGVLHLTMLGN
ncbi:MAG: hypothetical protein J7623_22515 [Chitinophaga sp.]|uniref:S41 family peptidase n=1 Tax=Chitinophaga sp. TaxID=1869181 RepID=UPI001B1D0403|nr:S41 family peptidase [Chitinophaga sp.]MBO9731431.1 hypothetical protein [Chitinophaga sp.]